MLLRSRTGVLAPAFLALCALSLSGAEVAAPAGTTAAREEFARRVYETTRLVGAAPRIDGQLDDAAWQVGTWASDFSQAEPHEGRPASKPTSLKILYDDRYLYIAIRAHDPEVRSLRRLRGKRDEQTGDMVGIAFDSYRDFRTAFQFDVTSGGSKVDLARLNDVEDTSWNAVWDVRVGQEADAWVAEYRIPLSQVRYSKDRNQVWGLHSWRRIDHLQEESHWQLIPEDNRGYVYSFGELRGITDLPRSRRIEILPYLSGKYATTEEIPGNPYRTGSETVIEGGLDAKIGLSSNFTLDLSINPDFGQVEADPSEINLNTFETLLEERRPFFLEGKSILEFGFGDVTQVFYPRRIGRAPSLTASGPGFVDAPAVTRILGAAKVTGKTPGGLSVGLLLAQTDEERARISLNGAETRVVVEPATNFSVVRMEQALNEGATRFGGILTATRRSLEAGLPGLMTEAGYTAGIDLLHYWGNRTYYVDFTLIGSRVEGSKAAITDLQTKLVHNFARPDAENLDVDFDATYLQGTGGEFIIGKSSNGNWRYRTSVDWRSPGFELNDIGYQRAADQLKHEVQLSYVNTRPGPRLRRYNVTFDYAGRYDFSLDEIQKDFTVNSSVTSNRNWIYTARTSYRTEVLDHRILRGGNALLTPDSITFSGTVTTDRSKPRDYRGEFSHAVSSDGLSHTTRLGTTFSTRLRDRVNVQAELSYINAASDLQYVRTVNTGGIRRDIMGHLDQQTLTAELRFDVNITPQLSLSFYGSPFLSAGEYTDFKRVTNSRASDYDDRFRRLAGNVAYNPATNTYTVTGDGTPYSFGNRDFNLREFKSNVVLRWEYKAGSTAFFVWSQNRTDPFVSGDFSPGTEYQRLFSARPDNTFVVKFSYWFAL